MLDAQLVIDVGRPIDHKNTLLGVFSFGMPSLHLFTFIMFFIILYNIYYSAWVDYVSSSVSGIACTYIGGSVSELTVVIYSQKEPCIT